MTRDAGRARRAAPLMAGAGELAVMPHHDYADGFRVVSGDRRAPPEWWARSCLEEAPTWLRWFVVFGWRAVLGLRLGPSRSTGHVLGWRVKAGSGQALLLEAESRLMLAQLHFRTDGPELVWTTLLCFRTPVARLIWVPVGLLHRRIVPYVITRAARRAFR